MTIMMMMVVRMAVTVLTGWRMIMMMTKMMVILARWRWCLWHLDLLWHGRLSVELPAMLSGFGLWSLPLLDGHLVRFICSSAWGGKMRRTCADPGPKSVLQPVAKERTSYQYL